MVIQKEIRAMNADSQSLKSTPFWRRKSVWLTLVVLLALGVGGGVMAFKRQAAKVDESSKKDGPPVTLEFAPGDIAVVAVRALSQGVSVSGSLVPVSQATVKSTVGGEVRRVLVREGEAVRQGAVLAEIDGTEARTRLEAALADQAERRARLDIAARNRDTNQGLLKQNFISQNAFDQLQSTYQASQAAVQWADAQVKLARQAAADTLVRAPMSGTVAKRMVNGGERVGVDAPLMQLVDLSRLELEATVPASDVARVAPGQEVLFLVDGFGARQFGGKVARINPVAEAGTRAIKLFVTVPNGDVSLRGGMFAQGAVTVSQSKPMPVIPMSAVFEEAGQPYVFAVESGKLAKHALKLGLKDEASGFVEVAQGLDAGIPVVRIRMNGLKVGAPAVLRDATVAAKAASAPV
jgi:membrane fusion protein, multidrug efflux system